MFPYLFHFVAFLAAAAIVMWTTPIVRAAGLKTGRFDLPNERKMHDRPMVRLGGISIFCGSIASLVLVWQLQGFAGTDPSKLHEILAVLAGGIAFFAIGLADDLYGLSPFTRLAIQTAVATICWNAGVSIDFLTIPGLGLVHLGWLSLPITVLWLVGMVNAINWIDGLDGLAAGVSGISATVMMFVALFMNQPAAGLIAAALAGAALGFLRYNFNPAQIFMGDGGAYFIGFVLAGVGAIGLVKVTVVTSVLLPYLILAVPLLDMSAVILDRLRHGKLPWIADKRHLHHRLLDAGLSHRAAVLFIYALTLWVGTLALAFSGMPSGLGYALAATALLSYTGWQVWRQAKTPS
ncbi:MAG: undecaprenyl/decaprenyl-phosphate alpha-N-acetylglucosaminyl 1-phosphate transferase [Oscillatoriales cyanobacterium]|nr:MAG: undecaprenyl/decaprenyl-phosphate alpha-N-acetylglucosaminyl 1-phosphate transferase [Oscillatoriales cyanobacterium]